MASADQKKSFLSKVPLFQGLKDRQLLRLADRMVERNYAAGDLIVKQGQGGEGFPIRECRHGGSFAIGLRPW